VRRLSLSSRHTMQSAAGAICSRPQTRCVLIVRRCSKCRRGERDLLRQAAETYIAGVGRCPKGGLEAIKQGLAREDSSDIAANRWRCESSASVPKYSRHAHSSRRSGITPRVSMQRLVQGMGQGITADETQLDTMAIEWVGVGPTEEATYLHLLERSRSADSVG